MTRRVDNGVEELEKDLFGYMPKQFVLYYYDLVERGTAQYTSPLGHAGESGSSGGRKKYTEHDGGLRDEAALTEKRRIDMLLRRMVRSANRNPRTRCPGCTQYVDEGWKFCAHCGQRSGGGVGGVSPEGKPAEPNPSAGIPAGKERTGSSSRTPPPRTTPRFR